MVNGGNYALAAGNIAAAKLTTRGGAYAKSPFEEVVMVTDIRGNKTSTVINKVRTDNTQISQKPTQRLVKDVQKEKENLQKLVGDQNAKLQAYNIERQTGIKVGTMGNALPGQPFANNTPQMRNSVFNNYNSNRTTISQSK